jgi:hypothetical protein
MLWLDVCVCVCVCVGFVFLSIRCIYIILGFLVKGVLNGWLVGWLVGAYMHWDGWMVAGNLHGVGGRVPRCFAFSTGLSS